MKLITKKCEVVGLSAAILEKVMPYIGHVVKYNSSRCFLLKENHTVFFSQNLLDLNWIKYESSDVMLRLKIHNKTEKKNHWMKMKQLLCKTPL